MSRATINPEHDLKYRTQQAIKPLYTTRFWDLDFCSEVFHRWRSLQSLTHNLTLHRVFLVWRRHLIGWTVTLEYCNCFCDLVVPSKPPVAFHSAVHALLSWRLCRRCSWKTWVRVELLGFVICFERLIFFFYFLQREVCHSAKSTVPPQ